MINPDGTSRIDRLGSDDLAPLVVGGQINPVLAANNIGVIKKTPGKTSHLSASDLDALILYLKALDRRTIMPSTTGSPTPVGIGLTSPQGVPPEMTGEPTKE